MEQITLPRAFIEELLAHFIAGAHDAGRTTEEAVEGLRETMRETGVPLDMYKTLIYWMKQQG